MANIYAATSVRDYHNSRNGGRNDNLDRYHDRLFNDRDLSSKYSDRFLERFKDNVGRARKVRQRYRSSIAARKQARAGKVDMFEQLYDIEDFQIATSRQRRAIMANPKASKMRRENRIDGYSHDDASYYNRNGHMHSNEMYRMLTNGYVVKEDDGKTYVNKYLQDEYQNEFAKKHLDAWARGNTRIMWSNINEKLDGDVDPTSIFNGSL